MQLSESQFEELMRLIFAFSGGNYQARGNVSDGKDHFDTIIECMNMMAEEIENTTVSRDFFSSIYNSASDMIIVVSPDGKIKNLNTTGQNVLSYSPDELTGKPIENIFSREFSEIFHEAKNQLRKKNILFSKEVVILSKKKNLIPAMLTCSKIFNRKHFLTGYLFFMADITEKKKTEQRILNSIIETQEQEQHRVSIDLHDSLGQEIVNAKTMFSLIGLEKNKLTGKSRRAIDSGIATLVNALNQIHSICFNLRPTELETFGLCNTIRQLIENLQEHHQIFFHFLCPEKIKTSNPSLEINIYRIVQEFITNSVKHAESKNIYINLKFIDSYLHIELRDDGKGFKMESVLNKGRGLNNIRTRVKAFNGNFQFISKPGKGTQLNIQFPTRMKNSKQFYSLP